MDTLKAQFDSAQRSLVKVDVPGAPGDIFTFNSSIYSTLDISKGTSTSSIA